MTDTDYTRALSMIIDKFPNIPQDLSQMEKLLQYTASGKKLPGIKLHRKVKSPLRSSKRNREQGSATDESEREAPSNKVMEKDSNKVMGRDSNKVTGRDSSKVMEKDCTTEEKISSVELEKVQRAKEKADAKCSRLQEAAQLAYAEVERLSKEIEELEASRFKAPAGIAHAKVERLSDETNVLKNKQAQEMTRTPSPKPSPSPGSKRWNSEVMNVRINNKKLNPEDFVMDVEDKGDEIDIKLTIK
ncbi:hypothetical protein KC19_1G083300 [Ceratodon purpureus]|uniref:Uncharacterized protein n=1 Tax=Ceratodon purpureus TaxID=3225 RepID=A0A8T0J624_CERPU|nr:hypothetical protein KC19_1G083300 [Ceratodon purpureus]